MKDLFLSMALLGQSDQPKEDFNLVPVAEWQAGWGSALAQNPANLKLSFWDSKLKIWWRRTYTGMKNDRRKSPL